MLGLEAWQVHPCGLPRTPPHTQQDAHVVIFPERMICLNSLQERPGSPLLRSSSAASHPQEMHASPYLLRLVEDVLEIAKRGPRELAEDFPEKLLRINGWAAAPVLAPSTSTGACCARIKAGCAVSVILLPLHLVA